MKGLFAIPIVQSILANCRDTFFFILGKRQSKLNFLNKWAGVYVQLTERQLRIYQSLADVEAENTVQRINLHALMVGWREMMMM